MTSFQMLSMETSSRISLCSHLLNALLPLLLLSLSPSKKYFSLVNCQPAVQNRANLTLTDLNGAPLTSPPLPAVFTSASALQKAYGPAVYSLSYSANQANKTLENADNFGCTQYVNPSLPTNFISIVSLNSICSVEDQIKVAYASGALALIIRNNISDLPTLSTQLLEKPFVSVLVSDTSGGLLTNYTLANNATYISIDPYYYSDTAAAMGSGASHELSPGSIAFIVIGTIGIIFIIAGMWIIFYLVQRARRVEERERYAEIVEKLTKKAISKTKCRKLKMDDKELVGNEICIICMDNFKMNDVIRRLPCSHYFHKSEIDTWLHVNQSCPVCKENLLTAFGLDVQKSSGFFRRILERLHLVPTPLEISEVVLAQSESRRGTAYSRRDTVFSVNTTHTNGESLYHGTRRNTFFGEHNMELYTTQVNESDTFNETEENEVQYAAAQQTSRRRLTFFGEKEDDLPPLPVVEELEKGTSSSNTKENKESSIPEVVAVNARVNTTDSNAAGKEEKPLTEIPL